MAGGRWGESSGARREENREDERERSTIDWREGGSARHRTAEGKQTYVGKRSGDKGEEERPVGRRERERESKGGGARRVLRGVQEGRRGGVGGGNSAGSLVDPATEQCAP